MASEWSKALRTAAAIAGGMLCIAPALAWAEHHEALEAAQAPGADPAPAAAAMRDVRQAWRRDPSSGEAQMGQRRAAQQMTEILQNLERSTRQLHSNVKAGAGHDETVNIARRIGTLLNDADVESRRLMMGAWMEERVRPAMALINEIAPYYGSGPLYDPETMQKLDRPPSRN